MEQRPGRQRSRATPIIAKGSVYPLTENHGSVSKKLTVWIDFERVYHKKHHASAWCFFFSNIKFRLENVPSH